MTGNHGDDNPFRSWVRLEQPRLGGQVTFATDEFFGAKERLIDPSNPVFIPDRYDDHGKWMDGWESRRKRTPGHDWCIVRLGVAGIVRGLDVDTSHFTGNFPPEVSVDACTSAADVPDGGWAEVLPRTPIRGNAHNYFELSGETTCTHLRLNIYPDGGVARLRVYGEVPAMRPEGDDVIDLAALRHGGRALAASDEHYGSMHNLNLPGRGINMGDGWETARRRGPGNDWVVLALGLPGVVERIEVDTAHFKGNYPDRVLIEGGSFSSNAAALTPDAGWLVLLPETKLSMDMQHYFDLPAGTGAVTHVRMSIYPDGGVSRLRVFGRVAGDDRG
ncbi:MAG TPA: allantoicase [Woeseiaceae bacterium]|nr:allantoicase [Woeseiaceae bacterium]